MDRGAFCYIVFSSSVEHTNLNCVTYLFPIAKARLEPLQSIRHTCVFVCIFPASVTVAFTTTSFKSNLLTPYRFFSFTVAIVIVLLIFATKFVILRSLTDSEPAIKFSLSFRSRIRPWGPFVTSDVFVFVVLLSSQLLLSLTMTDCIFVMQRSTMPVWALLTYNCRVRHIMLLCTVDLKFLAQKFNS